MTRVLLIGQVPETMDFTDPDLPYGFTVDTIKDSLTVSLKQIADRGWDGDLLQVMPDETAASRIEEWLQTREPYDCVVIGAGIRLPPKNLRFFENVINAVHRSAPHSAIGFNTHPEETVDAAARLLRQQ